MKSCRFYDKRIGQSLRAQGEHELNCMGIRKLNKIVIEYNGAVMQWISTSEDRTKPYPLDKEQTIELYDSISKDVNSTFPEMELGMLEHSTALYS